MSGLFVTFEGVEGAGKTTQIRLLRQTLEAEGRNVCVTREPGGDALAEGILNLLLHVAMTPRAELLLFLASRAQNVEAVIRPHLAAGGVVLCDRYIDSSVAYQGYARGLGRDNAAHLNTFATHGLMPDLTFLLDLAPEVGLARQQERNRMESESLEFHRRVREGYLAEAQNNASRFCILDAALPPDALQTLILTRTQAALQHISDAQAGILLQRGEYTSAT